jgi:hypothetical protein
VSVLRFTDSEYHFGIFKLFSVYILMMILNKAVFIKLMAYSVTHLIDDLRDIHECLVE